MLCYLDTNVIVYAVEGPAPFQQRAQTHLAALELAGWRFVVSDLSWTECLAFPFRGNHGSLQRDYEKFLTAPRVTTLSITRAIKQRAAMICAASGFSLADSLHLAAAVEHRIDRFLTNDQGLIAFPDLAVELLP